MEGGFEVPADKKMLDNELRESLIRFYTKHNINMLPNVDSIVQEIYKKGKDTFHAYFLKKYGESIWIDEPKRQKKEAIVQKAPSQTPEYLSDIFCALVTIVLIVGIIILIAFVCRGLNHMLAVVEMIKQWLVCISNPSCWLF